MATRYSAEEGIRMSSHLPLEELGQLVTVQYPDRPDLALIAALRLLAGEPGGASVAYVHGAVLTRRATNALRSTPLQAVLAQGRHLSDLVQGDALLVGEADLIPLILGPRSVLDITSTYQLHLLDLPRKLLIGERRPSETNHHAVVDYAYGVTGAYAVKRVDTPLAAAHRLMAQLGPLNRRRLEHDLRQLEPYWRQLRVPA
jgi:hypothetical protein